MLTHKQLFRQFIAQTSTKPLELEIADSKGIYLYDNQGNKYIDLISGISVSNLGHKHPKVIQAIQDQVNHYSHLMVYGEYIQSPQVKLAEILSRYLPEKLHNIYYVNSGSESVEGALKIAKKYTHRSEIIAFKNAYHGSTHGCLSIIGNLSMQKGFGPLLPEIKQLEFNNLEHLSKITNTTACVIIEPIQGEAGIRIADQEFLKHLREKCDQTETLLIFDEVQTGYGRTGKLFTFEHYKIIPDILCLAKAFGGGMPLGAFISSKEIMNCLQKNPVLGHITTFGGHPVSCAASMAVLEILTSGNLLSNISKKFDLFKKYLTHTEIKEVRGMGLFIAVELSSNEKVQQTINYCLKNGLITDWFLFADNCIRIAPPLTITEAEIKLACNIIINSL